jgi:hypothetical protein
MLFEKTQFLDNQGWQTGGAVTFNRGLAEFVDCLFDSNHAYTFEELSGSTAQGPMSGSNLLGSGMGGAVLAILGTEAHDAVRFTGCTFSQNNTAFNGGALALIGATATIDSCTFSKNRAKLSGFDIMANNGAQLQIAGSNITVTSPTVAWERLDASECLRGEYFAPLDGMCQRCAPTTFSLVTPTSSCLQCPTNAEVGQDTATPGLPVHNVTPLASRPARSEKTVFLGLLGPQ